jgi:hypothetical protein
MRELRSYDETDTSKLPLVENLRERYPGSFTAQATFEKAGAIVMTNGYVHERNPWGKSGISTLSRPHSS